VDEAQARRERFAEVVGAWLPGVYAYFRKLGLSEAGAEDAAQETFLAAWRNLASLRDPEKMRSWIYGTAYRTYLRQRRRRADPTSLETVAEAALPSGLDPGSQHSLTLRSLREAVTGLPEPYRQPVVLLYWEELSYQEAARALSIPLGTLAWRVRKALQLLRLALAEEGEPCGQDETSTEARDGRGDSPSEPGTGERDPIGDA
jgi:RNA polymerase sigma-70 factor, ECF subfamily